MKSAIQTIAIVLLLMAVACIGCKSNTGATTETYDALSNIPNEMVRVRVLENNTITYVHIPQNVQEVLLPSDTIWVNLEKHTLDDTDTSAMKAVIETRDRTNYYDGNGNSIPDSAVHLLVISQFAKLSEPEKLYLHKYFYLTN
jgi:hypothetical protein